MKKNKRFVQKLKDIFYAIINEFSTKFDNKIIKKISDILFIFTEKIALKFDYFLDYYIKYYDSMISSEIKLGSISKSNRVLHIGCGSIPASTVLISQKTDANVVCIDKDKKAVKNAKICIAKLKLSDKIKVKNVDALNFSFDNYDVVIIAQGINPIDKFLKHLSKKISKKTVIIFRTFSDDYGKLSKSDEKIKEFFKIEKIIRHEKQGKVISIILTVK